MGERPCEEKTRQRRGEKLADQAKRALHDVESAGGDQAEREGRVELTAGRFSENSEYGGHRKSYAECDSGGADRPAQAGIGADHSGGEENPSEGPQEFCDKRSEIAGHGLLSDEIDLKLFAVVILEADLGRHLTGDASQRGGRRAVRIDEDGGGPVLRREADRRVEGNFA